ncbi:hypothetical protein SMC26_18850 [Actinomadura fulvescens]|uniref:Uncharacterized protein n=1 Tax=Actinomadura fulvescens TaxID=46160 RepID=A0ABN3QGJ5_9ACTN
MALGRVLATTFSGCFGVWRFLAVWSRGRAAVALERERNAGTAQALKLLPPGGELLEIELGGRMRLLRVPSTTDHPPAPHSVLQIETQPPNPRNER